MEFHRGEKSEIFVFWNALGKQSFVPKVEVGVLPPSTAGASQLLGNFSCHPAISHHVITLNPGKAIGSSTNTSVINSLIH